MPKMAETLTAMQVNRLTTPGLHAVGGVPGLQLQINKDSARSWVLRAMVGIKRRDIGLGGCRDVTLAQARERARMAREEIWQGKDPVAERQARRRALEAEQSVPTFDDCVQRYLTSKTVEFKNEKHAAQWASTLEDYASSKFGKLPINQIGLSHIMAALEPIWTTKTETASRVRGRIEKVLSWATVAGYRTGDNPARWRGNLDAVLSQPGKVKKVEHHPALPYAAVPAFVAELREKKGIGARAVLFGILTNARSGEIRGATGKEIDLEAATWTIPASRMKAGKEHVVPLSAAAIEALGGRPQAGALLFPSTTGEILSDMTLGKVVKDLHEANVKAGGSGYLDPKLDRVATLHGFRSSFRDWAGETTAFPREVIEHALAHQLKDKSEAAYQRGDLLVKRSKLMNAWSRFCTTTPAAAGQKVVAIGKRAK